MPGFALENVNAGGGQVGIGAEGYFLVGGGVEVGVDALKIAQDLKVVLDTPPALPPPPPPPPPPVTCQQAGGVCR